MDPEQGAEPASSRAADAAVRASSRAIPDFLKADAPVESPSPEVDPPAEGDNPEAQAAPVPADEAAGQATGDHPEDASQPASETQTTEWERWTKRYGGDPEAAGKAAFEADSRAAAAAKKLKELEAKLATAPAQPAPVSPAVPAPEPPVAAAAAPMDLDQRVLAAVAADQECKVFEQDFADVDAQMSPLVTRDRKGNPIGGSLVELHQTITDLERSLDPERIKRLGLPELDEFQRVQLRDRLRDLKEERAEQRERYQSLMANREAIRSRHNQRVDQWRSHIQGEATKAREAEETGKKFVEDTAKEEAHWIETFDSVVKELGIKERSRLKLSRLLLVAARANDGPIAHADLAGWMRKEGKWHADTWAEEAKDAATVTAATYSAQKSKDAKVNAPNPDAAVAPERKPSSLSSSRDAHRRAMQGSKDYLMGR